MSSERTSRTAESSDHQCAFADTWVKPCALHWRHIHRSSMHVVGDPCPNQPLCSSVGEIPGAELPKIVCEDACNKAEDHPRPELPHPLHFRFAPPSTQNLGRAMKYPGGQVLTTRPGSCTSAIARASDPCPAAAHESPLARYAQPLLEPLCKALSGIARAIRPSLLRQARHRV